MPQENICETQRLRHNSREGVPLKRLVWYGLEIKFQGTNLLETLERREGAGRGEEASENFLKVNLSEELRGRFGD